MQKYLRLATEKAAEAVQRGVSEMVGLQRRLFTPEFLLVGLVEQDDSTAMRLIEDMTDDPAAVRQRLIEQALDLPADTSTEPVSPQSPQILVSGEVQGALEAAHEESQRLEDSFIGTGALFLGLFDARAGRVSTLLRESGLDLESTRVAYDRLRGGRRIDSKDAERKTDFIEQYTTDLTEMARHGQLDPVIGREHEIRRAIQILSRRKKNNPVIIGEPGVGKTVIAEGLAQRIADADVPETLLGRRVLSLDLGEVMAGAKMRGELEERVKTIRDEVIASHGQIILFVDELHLVVGGGDPSSPSPGQLLKPALARGQLQTIGATTTEEFKKHIEKDKALERRFQPILVEEPSVEMTIDILNGLKSKYEEYHQVRYEDDAIHQAAVMSERYITDRNLPDKAIDLIDEAGSRKHIDMIYVAPDVARLERERRDTVSKRSEAFTRQDFEETARLQQHELQLKREIAKARASAGENNETDNRVNAEDIATVVAEWTGIPAARIAESEIAKLTRMEENIHRRVIGQDDAVAATANAIRRNRAGLRRRGRPIGSFLFLGPTGVGKTELAKALAEFLLDDERKILRLDMSEYMERHQVARLIGAPPGYIGYGEGGQLTEQVRRRPYSVVLLDEIEKAHPDVFNILLQVLDEGTLTDSEGRTVSFRNTILIGTSNIGSARIVGDKRAIGFGAGQDQITYDEARRRVMEEVRKTFKPEFINRVDDIIVFHQLEASQLREILDLMLAQLQTRLDEREITLQVDDAVKDFLVEVGYSPVYGARPLYRELERRLENPLSSAIIDGRFTAGARVRARLGDDRVIEFVPAG